MSFYTALTGLNGSQAEISATSNNIANVGTTGFKRSRAEFGDIFATSPLQSASSSIGSGTILKGIKQQFTQGNIASSLNALDLAISGQGFFTLAPSLTASQTVYTRNGSFNVNNDRYVVDGAGQFLMTYPVNSDGSVTAKDLASAVPLQLPVTSGQPQATQNIALGVNVSSESPVVQNTDFNPANPETYTNSTSITIFDDLGNPTIATIYFIKTQTASATDPTNKYDTRLVIGDTVIDPDLVAAVDGLGRPMFIDRFGAQTVNIPDDNYFIENKGSPLYKLDDLNQEVPSQPAALQGEPSSFVFGEEGNNLVEIVTDPLMWNATVEASTSNANVYWGKDFLLVNVDDGDAPVSIDIRPGKYNAEQLAAEVERAVNEAYGDDKKIQLYQNVDDVINIDFTRIDANGDPVSLDDPIEIDLLQDSYVSTNLGINTAGGSPDFTREELIAHMQARVTDQLNDYILTNDLTVNGRVDSMGVESSLFARSVGTALNSVYTDTDVVTFDYTTSDDDGANDTSSEIHLAHTYVNNRSTLEVYDDNTTVYNTGGDAFTYADGIITVKIPIGSVLSVVNETVRIVAPLGSAYGSAFNGRSLTVIETTYDADSTDYYELTLEASGLSLSQTGDFDDADFSDFRILSGLSDTVEAFFEGTDTDIAGVFNTFGSQKIVLREIPGTVARTAASFAVGDTDAADSTFTLVAGANESVTLVGLGFASISTDTTDTLASDVDDDEAAIYISSNISTKINWADEKSPPLTVGYDNINQQMTFTADRGVLGTGGEGGFDSFSIYGDKDATATNRIGIPGANNAAVGLIRGGEVLQTASFIADGQEIQLQNKRYGIQVSYASDTQSFKISSGTTGEQIADNGAIGVTEAQKASDIKVGRLALDESGNAIAQTLTADRIIGAGSNTLFGFGIGADRYEFTASRGLASKPAVAAGMAAQSDLTSVFRLGSAGGENVFNVSVNGIAGIIEIPTGNYVGSTLAEALQEKINQISDPVTGDTVGGVTVSYSTAGNNFIFTTGTTGDTSTLKVKGSASLGLADVPLGVGTIPRIKNLVQATNSEGIALYVDAAGNVVTSPPENMVTGYYPLYIDEGELTFDKTGALVSPQNDVRYDQQSEGFSITLNIDYSASTQLAQPFSVLSVEQDGFTSGRLDGLEIDSSGTIRANYTNGENNPLGKIVIVNFNNQNGLKQIGNATYVETAVSGTPQVGEAGAEGFGTILSGSLERSNVDITEELVNLITAQRNYQASAKAIETTTSLNQTIINIRM
ncbi:MAG: flagellar hook-basal body complex protein [Proteobacteria bacterium]|nr:flagellar hook-basal body complex protein [Pseudomonadota bacterium]